MTDRDILDASGALTLVGVFAEILPVAVAFLAMLWYLVRFWALFRHWWNPEKYERPF